MTATRQLTVHNAQITTATVEVKTLTISGKQVTLAVFRQLREESLINDDGYLNGVPWGVVNYHPDKCGDASKHVHVVWQRGSELLRSFVWTSFEHRTLIGDGIANMFLTACAYEVLAGVAGWFDGQPLVATGGYSHPLVAGSRTFHLEEFPQVDIRAGAAETAVKAWNAYRAVEQSREDDFYARLLPEREQEYAQFLGDLRKWYGGIGATAAELYARLRLLAGDEMARRSRHVDARKAIADLPQLFIAV